MLNIDQQAHACTSMESSYSVITGLMRNKQQQDGRKSPHNKCKLCWQLTCNFQPDGGANSCSFMACVYSKTK